MITKKGIIKNGDNMSIKEKCEILNMSRSSYYYEAEKTSVSEIALKELIKDIFEARPTKGHRVIWKDLLETEISIGRDRTLKYMKEMGLNPIYPQKQTSIANKKHEKYPYLLRDLEIIAPNQVWAIDMSVPQQVT
ncbi:IS3 family transposase [bacterium]